MRIWPLSLLIFFLYALPSQAQVPTVSGTSLNLNQPVTEAWGVFAGDPDLTQGSAAPYNNCPIAPVGNFAGCHELRVNGDTPITVTFDFSGAATNGSERPHAAVIVNATTGSSAQNRLIKRNETPVTTESGQTTVTFTWRELCTRGGTSLVFDETTQSCPNAKIQVAFGVGANENSVNASTTVTFILYRPEPDRGIITGGLKCADVAEEDYGFCDIALFPGDSGGFLKASEARDNANQFVKSSFSFAAVDAFGTATTVESNIEEIRLFASETSFNDAVPSVASTVFFDLDFESGASSIATFSDNEFGKLKNGQNYFIRAATIDTSGTISQLFNTSYCNCPLNVDCEANTCPDYELTPSEVAGIIAENSCFITTVAYGSDRAHQVDLFRKFRKNFLFTNSLGRFLIKAYNTYGPLGAAWLKRNHWSKKYALTALQPFYGFAYLSVHHGIFWAFFIYSIILILIFRIISRLTFIMKSLWKRGLK